MSELSDAIAEVQAGAQRMDRFDENIRFQVGAAVMATKKREMSGEP